MIHTIFTIIIPLELNNAGACGDKADAEITIIMNSRVASFPPYQYTTQRVPIALADTTYNTHTHTHYNSCQFRIRVCGNQLFISHTLPRSSRDSGSLIIFINPPPITRKQIDTKICGFHCSNCCIFLNAKQQRKVHLV